MHTANLPILAHLIFESMAALSFLLQPRMQLKDPKASDEAILICQSYAGALLTTDVLCVLFLFVRGNETFDDASSMVAGSLAVYHIFPMRRAAVRIRKLEDNSDRQDKFAGGPWVHLLIHSLLLVSLVSASFYGLALPQALR